MRTGTNSMAAGCAPISPIPLPVFVLRDVANVGNEKSRRCRIGKIRMKQPAPIRRPTFGPMTSEDLLKQLYPAWGWPAPMAPQVKRTFVAGQDPNWC